MLVSGTSSRKVGSGVRARASVARAAPRRAAARHAAYAARCPVNQHKAGENPVQPQNAPAAIVYAESAAKCETRAPSVLLLTARVRRSKKRVRKKRRARGRVGQEINPPRVPSPSAVQRARATQVTWQQEVYVNQQQSGTPALAVRARR